MAAPDSITRLIPITGWIKNYDRIVFKNDLSAGLTVGVMLIPQGMAYAVLAGLPPVYGLYASIIPLLVYAVFGTSRQLSVGPVALISLLVLAGVSAFAEPGSDRFIQLAILTAFGVGVVHLLMGIFRMGFLVNFLSHPVLSGFTSAAALIIGASQIKNLLGLSIPQTNQVHEILWFVFRQISEINLVAAALGIGSILAIHFLCKWKKTFPAALFVVIAGILLTWLLNLQQFGLYVVGDIPGGFPVFSNTFIDAGDLQLMLPTILVISLVGYMESVAVAKAIATKRYYRIDANQELTGLGLANLTGAFFQAFPVAGGFSRSAVNDQAGAKTAMASIISAVLVALTVIFLTPLFYHLPYTVLAAIIIYAVSTLFDAKSIRLLWKTDRRDLALLLVTFFATLFLGIEEGIAVGVVLSLVMVVYGSTRPHSAVLGRLEGSGNYRNVKRYKDAITSDDVLIFRFDGALFFANATYFSDRLEILTALKGPALKKVILDASAIHYIDSTGIYALAELHRLLTERSVSLVLAGAIGPVRDRLKRSKITEKLGDQCFYFDVDEAMLHHEGRDISKSRKHSPNQTFS